MEEALRLPRLCHNRGETITVSIRVHHDTKCDSGLHFIQVFIACGALVAYWYSCDSNLVRELRLGLINCVILARKALTIECSIRLKGSFRKTKDKV